MIFGLRLNVLIAIIWVKGNVSSFVVVLLKVVESCWEYLEKGGVSWKSDVSLKGVAFAKGVGFS